MKSLTQEVVSAFETVHLLRCKTEDMDRCQANHGEIIRQFYMVEDGIKADLAKRLDEVRNDWLVVKDLPDNSLAEWINTVFDVAIKFVQEAE